MDGLKPGMVVKHFKREKVQDKSSLEYVYTILAFAEHTETGETLVIYQAMYGDNKVYARPYDMFMSKIDKDKYPNIKQRYRFEPFA